MIAKAERQGRIAGVGHFGDHVEPPAVEAKRHVELKRKGIGRARRRAVVQAKTDMIGPLIDRREQTAPGKAMARQAVCAALDHQPIMRQRADYRKQDRRVAAPECRIGIGHVVQALRVGQRPQFRAEGIDPHRQSIRGDRNQFHGPAPYARKLPPILATAATMRSAIAFNAASS